MKARKIAFLNCKGGVGKTSLSVNVAAALAKEERQKVLLVDMDAQSNASIWLMGIPRWKNLEGMLNKTVCGFFKTKTFLSEAVHKSVLEGGNPTRKLLPNLDLIPAVYDLLDLDHEYNPQGAAPYYLEFYNHIQSLVNDYNYIIFDCPPALGRASKCATFCCPEIYVPAHPDFLSSLGIKLLSDRLGLFLRNPETVAASRQAFQWKAPKVRGVILNAVPGNAKVDEAIQNINSRLRHEQSRTAVSSNAQILPTKIHESISAARLAGKFTQTGLPATCSTDNPRLTEDYSKIAHYIHTHPSI